MQGECVMYIKQNKGVISEWNSWDPRIVYPNSAAFDDGEDDFDDDLEEDPDAYLYEGGEYEPEDRPDEDDDIPEFDD